MEDISIFVDSVNGVLIAQDETKLVEEVMKKIVGYCPIEIPSDMKEASFVFYLQMLQNKSCSVIELV